MARRSHLTVLMVLANVGIGAGVAPRAHAHDGKHEHSLLGDADYRSPGLAVVLSLTPVPADFGNLYAENLGWGIGYTAIETSLAIPGMWLVASHMGHGGDGSRGWSGGEQAAMITIVSAYVVVKLVAAVHAGGAAQRFNEKQREPMARTAIVSWP